MKLVNKIFISILTLLLIICLVKATPGEGKVSEILAAPKIYVALGDSITQGANACDPHQECPEKSWATGDYQNKDSFLSAPVSIKEHLQALLPADQTLEVHNNARSFTQVSDLPNQAQLAVIQKAEVVTILSGANDICVKNENNITTDEDFRADIQKTLKVFETQLPKTKILVASIPNIFTLWTANRFNDEAAKKWSSGFCNTMLKNPASTEQEDIDRRMRVLDRVEGFNKIWEEECGQYVNCLFDNNQVFKTIFTKEDLSTTDYFHPSQKGQQILANTVWTSDPYIQRFVHIQKGKSNRSSAEAPIVDVLQPQNDEVLSGSDYRLEVQVESTNLLERVYADTQLGGVDLQFDPENKIWYLPIDTTLAPNGLSTSFTVVAVDEKKETAVSERIHVTVDNTEYEKVIPAPEATPDLIPETSSDNNILDDLVKSDG